MPGNSTKCCPNSAAFASCCAAASHNLCPVSQKSRNCCPLSICRPNVSSFYSLAALELHIVVLTSFHAQAAPVNRAMGSSALLSQVAGRQGAVRGMACPSCMRSTTGSGAAVLDGRILNRPRLCARAARTAAHESKGPLAPALGPPKTKSHLTSSPFLAMLHTCGIPAGRVSAFITSST